MAKIRTMEAARIIRGILAAIGITGTIAMGGSGHEISGSVFHASAFLHANLRGYQQTHNGLYADGSRVNQVLGNDYTKWQEVTVAKAISRWDMSRWQPGQVTILQAAGINIPVKYPSLTASLQQQAQAAVNAAGTPAKGNISTGGAKGVKGLYNALRSAGASQASAIGLIANAMNESSLNPEARAMDTNGFYSNGLWQFNESSYPDSGSLVTGHPGQDMIRQIQYLFNHGGLSAAAGSTPQQAAGNFASQFEKCAGCEPGGAQYNSRVGNVATVLSELGL